MHLATLIGSRFDADMAENGVLRLKTRIRFLLGGDGRKLRYLTAILAACLGRRLPCAPDKLRAYPYPRLRYLRYATKLVNAFSPVATA